MILEKLARRADPTLVTKALKQEVELARASFAVVRQTGSTDHYLLRGAGAHALAPVGTVLTFEPVRYFGSEQSPITAEVVSTGRSPHFVRAVAPPLVAMLAGTWAAVAGTQMLLGSGDTKQAVAVGLAVLVSGLCAMGSYVRTVARNQLGNFAAGYINTSIDDSAAIQVSRVEGKDGVCWPRREKSEVTTVSAPAEVAALPPPAPDASLVIRPVKVPVPVLAR